MTQDTPTAAPERVAILGLGYSLEAYSDLVKRLGGRHVLVDEVWGINAVGGLYQCDRIFHMDDVRVQERRAAAKPESNIARMLEWMRKHPGPIYTSRAHPDYPGLVDYPLADVITNLGNYYFNSTAAYAVAYAIHIGVKEISFFGIDFTYPNAHHAEKGRACVEYWIGQAHARGLQIIVSGNSALMDAIEPEDQRLYGYDTLNVTVAEGADGQAVVTMTERAEFATAEEIEARYDHTKHPNPLVSGQAA